MKLFEQERVMGGSPALPMLVIQGQTVPGHHPQTAVVEILK